MSLRGWRVVGDLGRGRVIVESIRGDVGSREVRETRWRRRRRAVVESVRRDRSRERKTRDGRRIGGTRRRTRGRRRKRE